MNGVHLRWNKGTIGLNDKLMHRNCMKSVSISKLRFWSNYEDMIIINLFLWVLSLEFIANRCLMLEFLLLVEAYSHKIGYAVYQVKHEGLYDFSVILLSKLSLQMDSWDSGILAVCRLRISRTKGTFW